MVKWVRIWKKSRADVAEMEINADSGSQTTS